MGLQFQKQTSPADTSQQWENWDWATATQTQQTVIVTGTGQQAQPKTEQATHWIDSLLHMQYAKQWDLEIIEPDSEILKEAMQTGEAVAVSDRSFMQRAGAAIWTIKGLTKEGRCIGTSFTPGEDLNQSAIRVS